MFCCIVLVFQKQGGKKISILWKNKDLSANFSTSKGLKKFFFSPYDIYSCNQMNPLLQMTSQSSLRHQCLSLHLDFGRPVIMISLISYYLAKLPDQIGTEKFANLRRQIKKFAKEQERQNWYIKIYVKTFSAM